MSILKKLVSDNITVLAEFVSSKENLGINHFKLIELMIRPPVRGQKLPEPWAKREFLCEVSQYLLTYVISLAFVIVILPIITLDCC